MTAKIYGNSQNDDYIFIFENIPFGMLKIQRLNKIYRCLYAK